MKSISNNQKADKEQFGRHHNGVFEKLIVKPIVKLLTVKIPVYTLFLGAIGLLFVSQFVILYSNHSIFMKLSEVADSLSPLQSELMEQQRDETSALSTASFAEPSLDTPSSEDESVNSNSDNMFADARDGVFFSNTSYDFRECTSPESDVPWPLEGDVHSKTSESLTCGLGGKSSFATFFGGDLWKRKFEPLTSKCKKLVVFGVAFGGNFVKDLDAPHVRNLINATDLLNRHGRCFFILTTERDIEDNADIITKHNSPGLSFIDPVVVGHNTLIPLPSTILPYKNPRRNVKLLKYVGQYIFPETETVIWQDAKFFRNDFVSKQPLDYNAMVNDDACVSTIGLPVHKITVGLDNINRGIKENGRYTAQYEDHCSTIINALADRPDVTDSSENLINQCDAYLQHVYKQDGNIEILNQGLIDSAFIVWNHKTQSCRDFSESFRCTIVDQIQCHADRDQVSIPFAMHQMGVAGRYRERQGEEYKKVDQQWDPRIHDLDFIVDKEKATPAMMNDEAVKIRVTRSSCHWYFSRLGNCRTDLTEEKATIALLITGTAKKFIFDGLTEHFIKPLVKNQKMNVDFYLMLSIKQGIAFRNSNEFMKYQTYDPIFQQIAAEKDASIVAAHLFENIRNTISKAGANIGGVHIQPQPIRLDVRKLRRRQTEAKKARPKEDSYYRFPTLDLRPDFVRRTAVANRNLFKIYLALQKLWDKHLLASETYVGVRYEYVMVLREDVSWMADFDMQKLIDTNPYADAYVLSCDLKDPPMIANEYSDIGIVIKRSKAHILGRYFSQLLDTNLQKCHDSVKKMVPADTGCNNGMLLYHIFKKNGILVQKVPQSVFPIQRSINLKLTNSTSTTRCIHSLCQSSESPLSIPDDMRSCDDIQLS